MPTPFRRITGPIVATQSHIRPSPDTRPRTGTVPRPVRGTVPCGTGPCSSRDELASSSSASRLVHARIAHAFVVLRRRIGSDVAPADGCLAARNARTARRPRDGFHDVTRRLVLAHARDIGLRDDPNELVLADDDWNPAHLSLSHRL